MPYSLYHNLGTLSHHAKELHEAKDYYLQALHTFQGTPPLLTPHHPCSPVLDITLCAQKVPPLLTSLPPCGAASGVRDEEGRFLQEEQRIVHPANHVFYTWALVEGLTIKPTVVRLETCYQDSPTSPPAVPLSHLLPCPRQPL